MNKINLTDKEIVSLKDAIDNYIPMIKKEMDSFKSLGIKSEFNRQIENLLSIKEKLK